MNSLRLALLLSIFFTFLVGAQDRSQQDMQVLAACMRAVVSEAASYTFTSKSSVVYVNPEGESSLGFVSEGQLRSELYGADWDRLRGPFEMPRSRLREGWSPPATLDVKGYEVVVSNPPMGEFGYEHLHFVFWPPGYSSDGKTSVVRALFEPAAHGAGTACELSLHRGTWIVMNKWVSLYT